MSFLTICSIYILISLRPEGQHPKQFRINSKANKIAKFSMGLKNWPKIRKIDPKWLKMGPIEVTFLAPNILFMSPHVLRKTYDPA